MKRSYGLLAGLMLVAMVQTASSQFTVYYVSTDGTGDGSSWASPTNSIQGAIDAIIVTATSTVYVTNGVYDVGGVTDYPAGTTLSNRVAIHKPITVRSWNNDPSETIIKGNAHGSTNGPTAIRCVYMTNDASLIGFMLTNGATLAVAANGEDRVGGAVWSAYDSVGNFARDAVLSNCLLIANRAQRFGGGAKGSVLYDCTISYNTAGFVNGGGGGTYHCDLYRCQIVSNWCMSPSAGGGAYGLGGSTPTTGVTCYIAGNTVGHTSAGGNPTGGGMYSGVWLFCTVVVNRAVGTGNAIGGGCGSTSLGPSPGDGFDGGELYNCVISGNTATTAGGVGNDSYASNCVISANSSKRAGGGVSASIVVDCTIVDNTGSKGGGGVIDSIALRCNILTNIAFVGYVSGEAGGGAHNSTLTNCLLAANSAVDSGGGASRSILVNCTIVNNTASGNGGGVDDSAVTDCISFGNNVTDTTVVAAYSMGVGYPLVDGNITDDPLFINAAAGNYRLTQESPCKNTGTDLDWTTDDFDLDGEPRLVGTVDMGAYEAPLPPGTVIMIQ